MASAVAGFVACLAGRIAGGGGIDVAWAPTLGLRLDLAFDGLGALYALLATGIGAAVFVYGAGYLPLHLRHEGRPAREAWRFWPWMVLFMAAMVGLACARDLVLLFVLFDLTAVASYFLIGFDRERREARGAALMAMLVTGISAVALLIGAVLLYGEYGTFSLPELIERAEPTGTTTAAAALIAVAALAKSAQVPLHFWLPRAMAAPTPVSAYLHSAAMVAAGVLVLGRVHPLLALDDRVLDGLLVIGLASVVVGGLLALAQDELKQILAHSTISQYGYVVAMYGIGGEAGAAGAALYVVAHAVAKSALFMTAGTVTEATGESRLSRLGGLGRRMPVLAVASGLAAATLAALPLTLGFFKDELFFAAAVEAGPVVAAMSVVAAALTFAYIGRFWLGIFTGAAGAEPHRVSPLLVGPVVLLAAVAVAGGVVVEPFALLAEGAAAVTHGGPVPVDPAYHLDTRAENLMALAAYALGALVLLASGARHAVVAAVGRAGDVAGPRRLYGSALSAVNRWSDGLHGAEVRDLRNSIAAVLLPTGVLIAIAFAITPTEDVYRIGDVDPGDLPMIVLLVLAIAAAVTVARDDGRVRPVLALSVLGFALAGVYAIVGAPDVALVALVVESVVTLAFIGVFSRLPSTEPDEAPRPRRRSMPSRNVIAGVLAGLAAFAAIWAALSRTSVADGDAAKQIAATPSAHGGDVVTVTLADFRGLDTMVEITVLAVAVVGVASLLRRGGRTW
ncbi:hydrogen gas-evolving membrane-bound hydrogenase subunit E [Miltoncostaea oceani]|uniref:hydrogen gas-evolving membrane-bound hydrogenase subunit E n=1 Tax=Miltoncostaea oceani TaxID=2843216 RepID=UPI001C3CC64C|nr:hydrogen gas-evolving membrane-bound hydrogenase subunit E [Miltoncostaea oceani]